MSETENPTPEAESEHVVHAKHAEVTHNRHGHLRSVKVFLEPDDFVKGNVGGFVTFLRDHAVVGVAIGFIIGLQAQTLVKQLVTSFVTPILTLIVGPNLQHKTLYVSARHGVSFPWGQFVYALADFLVVLLFIYLIVKLFRLDKLDTPQATAVATTTTKSRKKS